MTFHRLLPGTASPVTYAGSFHELISALRHDRAEIELRGNLCGKASSRTQHHIAKAIAKSKGTNLLSFRGIHGHFANSLKGLTDNCTVLYLKLDSVSLESTGAGIVSKIIINNHLEKLQVSYCDLRASDCAELFEAIAVNTSLMSFTITEFAVAKDEVAEAIGNMLQTNKTLQELCLQRFPVSELFGTTLGTALEENETLLTLEIDSLWLPFDATGFDAICNGLNSDTCTVTSFRLGLSLSSETFESFSVMIKANTKLSKLVMLVFIEDKELLKSLNIVLEENQSLDLIRMHGWVPGGKIDHDELVTRTRHGETVVHGHQIETSEVTIALRAAEFSGDIIAAFFENKTFTLTSAAALSPRDLMIMGVTTLSDRQALKEFLKPYEPSYLTSDVGEALVEHGLRKYAEQFYNDGVLSLHDAAKLSLEDLQVVGLLTLKVKSLEELDVAHVSLLDKDLESMHKMFTSHPEANAPKHLVSVDFSETELDELIESL